MLLDVQVKILDKRIGTKFPLPTYATEKSSGIDLCACNEKKLAIEPNESHLVSTGISIYLKNPDYTAIITPRSGLGSKRGIVLGNLTGIIDPDYQGPLMVCLWNRSNTLFVLEPGTRMAQMLIVPIVRANFQMVEEFDTKSQRGSGGFGHSGQ